MNEFRVLLVSMPWEALTLPSLQVGTLRSVLERTGVPTQACSFKLAFMEHCRSATAERPPAGRIQVDDYHRIGRHYYDGCLSDWVFAVPPFRDARQLDDDNYLDSLRKRGIPDADIAKAQTMRAIVPPFLEACVDEILAAAPSLVAFLAPQHRFVPMAYTQSVPSLALAKLLRARQLGPTIVFAGVNCTGAMGVALHRCFPWIDVVIRGDAETILPALAGDLACGSPLRPQPGLIYRSNGQSVVLDEGPGGGPSLDDLPLPNHDEYFDRLRKTGFCEEVLPSVTLPYEASRGCWWGAVSPCTFCGLNGTSMAFRSKQPEHVVEELTQLASRYGCLNFNMVDNIMDPQHLRDVLPRLRECDFSIFYEVKANLTKEQLRLLREAGVDRFQPGIESLSTPILKLMRKGVTALQNVRLLKWCAEYGIRVFWNLLYGIPGEPVAEYERMAEVMPSLTHLMPPQLVPLWVARFSPYFERPAEFGLEILGPAAHYRVVYPVDTEALHDLAHVFEHRHVDGRDPERYVQAVRAIVEDWTRDQATGYRSLRYRRGFDFLRISDRRPNLPARDYTLREVEARIYLACADGRTPTAAHAAVSGAARAGVSVEDVRELLDELVTRRLVYEEDGHYLSLALPGTLLEEAPS
jgi:ribosomal peptide maturation radical SAM protein 1